MATFKDSLNSIPALVEEDREGLAFTERLLCAKNCFSPCRNDFINKIIEYLGWLLGIPKEVTHSPHACGKSRPSGISLSR